MNTRHDSSVFVGSTRLLPAVGHLVLAAVALAATACGAPDGTTTSSAEGERATEAPAARSTSSLRAPTTGIAPDPAAARTAPPDVVAPDVKTLPTMTTKVADGTFTPTFRPIPEACTSGAWLCGSPVYASPPYPLNWTSSDGNLMGVEGPCTRDRNCADGLTCQGGVCLGPNNGSIGLMEADVKEDGVTGGPGYGAQAVGFLVATPTNYSVDLVVRPNYVMEWTSYMGSSWPSSHSSTGTISIYIQDTTAGTVVVNQASTLWNISEDEISGSVSNTSPGFATPCAYGGGCASGTPWRVWNTQPSATFAMTPGHTYAVWVWAAASANYNSTDDDQMFVQVSSIEYYWQPE